jgi:hypothetical protein
MVAAVNPDASRQDTPLVEEITPAFRWPQIL